MPKVSVIMPSLNVAKYIGACMDSVVNQTLSDIEIIAVDAGSTDGTAEILQEYAERDKRIRLIHSDKKSYGYQMNLGLDAARGEYIAFVETDDFIEPDMLAFLTEKADEYGLDYAKGCANSFWELKNGLRYEVKIGAADNAGRVIRVRDMPEMLIRDIFLWLGVYRSGFLKNIRFNETPGAAFQDQGFLLRTLSRAERAMYTDKIVYWYRQDNEGASNYNPRSFSFIASEYSINEKIFSSVNAGWRPYFYTRLWLQTMWRYRRMTLSTKRWDDATQDISSIHEKLKVVCSNGEIVYRELSAEAHALLKLFLQNPAALGEYFSEKYIGVFQTVERLISWAANRIVLIYGAGKWGKFAHALLDLKGRGKVAAFVDGNEKLHGKILQGLSVLSPGEAAEKFPDAYYLIAVKGHRDEIYRVLMNHGVEESRIHREHIVADPAVFEAGFPQYGGKRDQN